MWYHERMATTDVPKYEAVKLDLIRRIESGVWRPGESFPSEHELLTQFDVSRPTLVRSLQEMVSEGYLTRRQGKGTFVAERKTSRRAETATPPFTVFLAEHVAQLTGPAREVQLRILKGIQDALGPVYNGSVLRQAVADAAIDGPTRHFIEHAPRGVALMIEPSFNLALWNELHRRGWVVWSINEPIVGGNCVVIDQQHAGFIATKFLLEQGRRRIALINGPTDVYWGFQARLDGYRQALAEAGIAFDPACVRQGVHALDSEAGRAMMRSLMQADPAIDGVVGASDSKAIGAMTYAMEQGICVPDEIAFVGIDNTVAAQAQPALPAVAMPFEEMGYQAATQALASARRSRVPRDVHTNIKLQPTLIRR